MSMCGASLFFFFFIPFAGPTEGLNLCSILEAVSRLVILRDLLRPVVLLLLKVAAAAAVVIVVVVVSPLLFLLINLLGR